MAYIGPDQLVGPADGVFGAPVQQFVAFGIRQRRVVQRLAAFRLARLELGHVRGKDNIENLPGHAPQFGHVHELRQPRDSLELPGALHLNVRRGIREGVEPHIPGLDAFALHLRVHDVIHHVEDFIQRVRDRRPGEQVDARAPAPRLHIVRHQLEGDGAVAGLGVQALDLHPRGNRRLFELVRFIDKDHVDAKFLERNGAFLARAIGRLPDPLEDRVALLHEVLGRDRAHLLHGVGIVHVGQIERNPIFLGRVQRLLFKGCDFLGRQRHQGFLAEAHARHHAMGHDDRIPIVAGDALHRRGDIVLVEVVHKEEPPARIHLLRLGIDSRAVGVVGEDQGLLGLAVTAAFDRDAGHRVGLAGSDLMGIKPALVVDAPPDGIPLVLAQVERAFAARERHAGEGQEVAVILRIGNRPHGVIVGCFESKGALGILPHPFLEPFADLGRGRVGLG